MIDFSFDADGGGAHLGRGGCPRGEELIARLKERRTESEEKLQLRIDTAREELHKVELFDYYVVNADGMLDATIAAIVAIIESEHRRSKPRQVRL